MRVHSECLTGDVFGSQRCDCGPQLDAAMAIVAAEGRGVVLYMRGHEGRGIGLMHKLQAYLVRRMPVPTPWTPISSSGCPPTRVTTASGPDLADLGVRSMRLLTNNPAKRVGLDGYGLHIIERVPLPVRANSENIRYLMTKRDRMGHELGELDDFGALRGDVPAGGSRMSGGAGVPDLPDVDASAMSLAIVASTWHGTICDALLTGSRRVAETAGIPESDGGSGARGDRDTGCCAGTCPHTRRGRRARCGDPWSDTAFRLCVRCGYSGLTRVSLDEATPVANGVLTTDTRRRLWTAPPAGLG